ncbi:heme ABC exporter ATP-binding protein CcmA [Anaplasma platys]|nr:heme ABC exporter ATP-binding protein CcmA [Anaplasma platys]
MIECSNVSCIRGNRVVFQNLSFSADSGVVTIIAGKNGCGKSTLLRAIVGLVPVAFGCIRLNGEAISTSSSNISDITYIGHTNACIDHLTTLNMLEMWATMRNNVELIPAAVSFFSLHQVLDTKYKNLSSGWKRKVALSRLLVFNTDIWVIDEPFANLDTQTALLVHNLISTRAERRGIVLLSHHGSELSLENANTIDLEAYSPHC